MKIPSTWHKQFNWTDRQRERKRETDRERPAARTVKAFYFLRFSNSTNDVTHIRVPELTQDRYTLNKYSSLRYIYKLETVNTVYT